MASMRKLGVRGMRGNSSNLAQVKNMKRKGRRNAVCSKFWLSSKNKFCQHGAAGALGTRHAVERAKSPPAGPEDPQIAQKDLGEPRKDLGGPTSVKDDELQGWREPCPLQHQCAQFVRDSHALKLVVIRRAFFFFSCNYIINIQKIFFFYRSFSGEVKDSVIFPL